MRETNGLLGTDGQADRHRVHRRQRRGPGRDQAGRQHDHDHEHGRRACSRSARRRCSFGGRWTTANPGAGPVTQPTFRFKIDNGAYFSVQAGKCSPPKRVSVGNHTVTEVNENDYELDAYRTDSGIAVFPADREVSRSLATRTVTVSVPWGPNGETLVTFYNRVKRAKIKVCKVIPPTSQDSLGRQAVQLRHQRPRRVGPILPGECTFYTRDIPILVAPGHPDRIVGHEVGLRRRSST